MGAKKGWVLVCFLLIKLSKTPQGLWNNMTFENSLWLALRGSRHVLQSFTAVNVYVDALCCHLAAAQCINSRVAQCDSVCVILAHHDVQCHQIRLCTEPPDPH